MATTLSAIPGHTKFQGSRTISALVGIVSVLLKKLRPWSERASCVDEAIEILRDDANPDLSDWAECYLCGMVDSDIHTFLARRRWQS